MKKPQRTALLLALGLLGGAVAAARRARRLDLRGRVAIVTGGGRGLGLAITRELLQRGCRVAICGRDGEVIRRAVEDFERQGFQIIGSACDTSEPEQVDAFVGAVLANHGSIDVLVNNAAQCYVGPASELEAVDMLLALKNIFWAQYYPTMAVLPHMRARGFGRIANVTSMGGKVPLPHQAAYVAAKYAATGWSQTLGIELAQEGITVSTIAPPPLRNGAPLHAHFNGRREAELAWFAQALTSPFSAVEAERAARAVVEAILYGQHERNVSLGSWLSARAHGLAPNLFARSLVWVARRMPAAAAPGIRSPMRLGAAVARSSHDHELQRLVRRARADEARYMPSGMPSVWHEPSEPSPSASEG
jgi:NAD(P)-dependent dehydrogenase (short-subunit alcohol dehydrogenase family)